jgi:hypothetical protein
MKDVFKSFKDVFAPMKDVFKGFKDGFARIKDALNGLNHALHDWPFVPRRSSCNSNHLANAFDAITAANKKVPVPFVFTSPLFSRRGTLRVAHRQMPRAYPPQRGAFSECRVMRSVV